MTNSVLSTLAAGTLAGAALGLAATANVASSGISSAESTVNQLKSQGYQVVVNRVGTGPVDQSRSERFAPAKRTRAPTPTFPAPTTTS